MNNYLMFLLYTIFWQCLVWLGFGFAVFILGYPGWWFALAFVLASLQYSPREFGIYGYGDDDDD